MTTWQKYDADNKDPAFVKQLLLIAKNVLLENNIKHSDAVTENQFINDELYKYEIGMNSYLDNTCGVHTLFPEEFQITDDVNSAVQSFQKWLFSTNFNWKG